MQFFKTNDTFYEFLVVCFEQILQLQVFQPQGHPWGLFQALKANYTIKLNIFITKFLTRIGYNRAYLIVKILKMTPKSLKAIFSKLVINFKSFQWFALNSLINYKYFTLRGNPWGVLQANCTINLNIFDFKLEQVSKGHTSRLKS